MSERFTKSGFLLGLLAFTVACIGLPDFSSHECAPSVLSRLLGNDAFPSGWVQEEPREDDQYSGGAVEHCRISFYVTNGSAFEEIYEYKNEDESISGYAHLEDVLSWEQSDLLSAPDLNSFGADQSYWVCGQPGAVRMCKILARYGVYVVHFNTHMSPTFMTETDLLHIVDSIDTKMQPAQIP